MDWLSVLFHVNLALPPLTSLDIASTSMGQSHYLIRFAKPVTVKGLQEFVGIVNFYHHFVPSTTKIMQPLFKLIVNKPNELIWDNVMMAAFTNAKQALANSTMLVHPRLNAPTVLTVDASCTTVGAVLEQLINGCWQPLAFFSCHLRVPEQKYCAFDHELLALFLAV